MPNESSSSKIKSFLIWKFELDLTFELGHLTFGLRGQIDEDSFYEDERQWK
jgi:hypothetical protein